ncbi:RFESD protein, partial [Polyodon spathula]|nr:RFESD protein [Polyodon spathula]
MCLNPDFSSTERLVRYPAVLPSLLNLYCLGCFEGGPLCEGDIEEADGVLKVFCPWHDYDFDIRTGESQTGLQQQVYEVKVEDGLVYVKHRSQLSLTPFPAAAKE